MTELEVLESIATELDNTFADRDRFSAEVAFHRGAYTVMINDTNGLETYQQGHRYAKPSDMQKDMAEIRRWAEWLVSGILEDENKGNQHND